MTAHEPESHSTGVPVALRDLTVAAGPRVLLERASALFEPRQVTLILGPSGAGKSLLLRVIAGLLDRSHEAIRVTGSVAIGSGAGQRPKPSVGVVFQSFALFDELSPAQNVRFAHSHRRGPRAADGVSPLAILDELDVPRGVRTSWLSGGQQQRLAIARTLAADPDVVLYDEPTSGLDAATSAQVAALIQRTHSRHPKTAIIVTHDYESLAPIADRIYLIDAETHTLRRVERAEWPDLRAHLVQATPARGSRSDGALSTSWWSRRRAGFERFLADTTRAAEAALTLPLRLFPWWRSQRWGLWFLAHYLRLVAGPSAWTYLAVTGLIVGFVATHFTFAYLPYARYTEPLITEEVLGAIGYALFRVLIPLIATILVAARCGAAVASDVGNKTYGRQMDALRSLGASPRRYVLTNVLWSFLIGTPVLVLVAFFVARWTSLVVFTANYPELGPTFWEQHIDAQIASPGAWFYEGTGWMLAKVVCCAAGIASIAYYQGARPKPSSTSVSSSITSAILWATLYVLAVHCAFAFVEFEPVE